MSKLIIKKASLEDMNFFVVNAKEEGWNPGLHDAVPFFNTDPHGFFIGTIGKETIGCISAVAYNDDFGFIGFFIVLPAYRKRGFGHQLWVHGLNYLGNRCIGLDGVLKEQEHYEQSHFQLYYKNQRFERKNPGGYHSHTLVNLREIPFEILLNYDLPIFGLDRAIFLKQWIAMPNAFSLGKMKDRNLMGYGVLRSCYEGYKVGPLFADNDAIALEIFEALCAKAGRGTVFIDVPENNPQALKLAQTHNFKGDFETVRMYNKAPPKQQLDKVFGVTSFELG